jgi:phosphatidylglycerol:prolipoprotein diacylglycerol transferase
MHPTLFRIGSFQITTYGLMLALAFAIAGWLMLRRGEKEGIPVDFLQNLMVAVVIAGLVGSRVLYVIVNLNYFRVHPFEMVFSREGYVFIGGLLVGLGTALFLIHRHRQDVWRIGDLFAPYLAMAQGIGRLGCFGFGCCFGRPSSLPWAVRFPRTINPVTGDIDGSPAYIYHLSEGWIDRHATHSLPVHPTQLYDSAVGWLNLLFLLYLRRRGCRTGELWLAYLMFYSVTRFLTEFARGDPRGEVLRLLSTTQAVGIVIFFGALGTLIWRRARSGGGGRGE